MPPLVEVQQYGASNMAMDSKYAWNNLLCLHRHRRLYVEIEDKFLNDMPLLLKYLCTKLIFQ